MQRITTENQDRFNYAVFSSVVGDLFLSTRWLLADMNSSTDSPLLTLLSTDISNSTISVQNIASYNTSYTAANFFPTNFSSTAEMTSPFTDSNSYSNITEINPSNQQTEVENEWITQTISNNLTTSGEGISNGTSAHTDEWMTTDQSKDWMTTLNTTIATATSSDWITEASSLSKTLITSTTYTDNWTLNFNNSLTTLDFTNTSDIDVLTTESMPILVTSGDLLIQTNHEIFIKYLLPSLIYVLILLAMGIPGNVLILFVYGRRWRKTTSRNFIMALAAYDLFNCICSISVEITLLLKFILFDMPLLCKFSRFVTGFLNYGSTFVLVAIAYDRFRRICQPLRKPFNPESAKKIIICSVVFAVLTAWPALLLYGTYSVPIRIPNSNYIVVGKTCLIDDDMINTKYPLIWILFLLLSHFVVDVTFVVLYSCVGRAVFKRRSKLKTLKGSYKKAELSTTYESSDTIEVLDEPSPRKKPMAHMSFVFHKDSNSVKMNNRHGSTPGEGRKSSKIKDLAKPLEKKLKTRDIRAGRTTIMLFLVTVVFIVSYIPHTAIVILRSRDKMFYAKLSDTGKVVYQLLLRSYFLNCVLNPIVYCFVNKQFRKECKKVLQQIFCCKTQENTNIRK